MWIAGACQYLLNRTGQVALVVPFALIVAAWFIRRAHPVAVRTWRSQALVLASASGAIAISGYAFQALWWRILVPSLGASGAAYCESSPGSDYTIFLATAGSFIFAVAGSGPGRVLILVAASALVLFRASLWSW